jgi:hypothetical protein
MVGWFLVLNATLSNISAISPKRRIALLSRYGLLGYIKLIQKACPYTIVCVVFIKYFGTWRVWALYQHQASFFICSYPTLYAFPVAVKTNNSQPIRMTDQSHVTFFKYEFLRQTRIRDDGSNTCNFWGLDGMVIRLTPSSMT